VRQAGIPYDARVMNRRRHFQLPFLALALGALAGCGRADSPVTGPPAVAPKSVVAGTVRDTGGVVIAGATVTLRDTHVVPGPSAGRVASPAALAHDVLMLTSGADGSFAFEPLPAGDYVVSATASGYLASTRPVYVAPEGGPNDVDTTHVDIPLTPL